MMTRREAIKLAAGAGMALLAGGALVERAGATGGSTYFRTTTALNLRAKPSTSGKILLVIPAGARVKNLGDSSNGYRKVSYKGTTGWAYGTYLKDDTPSNNPDYRIIGEAVTTTAVNLRAGASSNAKVLRVLAKGTRVSVSDQKHNGYRYVIADGYLFGWVYDDYLSDVDEQGPLTFKTDRDVNLRAEPNKNAKVLKVVPKGATVTDYDLVMANGYRGVDYKGTAGWIYDDYLDLV
jgi:uncharacterized protein YgiM (DUF1202 family)